MEKLPPAMSTLRNSRLPELSLPQFNGDIETWFIFKEQFKEIIENCGLNDKQKLQYLQSCLIGIAKHVQTVDDTYDSLFLALEQRFENKRLIINKHINAMLMLKYEKFRGDSNVDLRNLVDTCTKHLRALKLLNFEHNTFSELLLIQLVMQVLDTETKRLFEMTLESTDIPKWDDFLAFLNKRCLFLENLPSAGTKGKQNFKDSPRHKSFILHTDANVDKKCKLCSLNHDLYNCDKFKNMPVRDNIRFKKYVVAFSSDIKKIFRQIKVQEHQQDFLRILWRPSPEEDIVSYRLKTVTYGTKPAPYLATRCLLQLAHEGKNKYPLATPVIENSTYILSGADDITTAKEIKRQLIGLMKEGCFHFYKWSANSEELLKDMPTENKEFLFNENDELVKTLGLSWRPREDAFMYQMNLQEVPVTITKRTVLSFISKLYDPLGLLQPIIIKAKMMIQKIWLLKIDWGQNLPRQEIENFQRYVAELHQLKDLKIPRCILLKDSVAVHLIGFADASAQAYGACLYVKFENANETQIRLLCSKTHVAPLTTLSIPRLELLALRHCCRN
ncbi:integrase_H2C2 domain-containing protein [Trichonephila clavata]|uniref:Integrase_H2C2 domain-containing protein n=1 Tax=Trichonephila clavata TaxID=2740835 RepID=A0A8X6GL70_TRICU|nr:integrase_H2C2 domain-containing protein [Trichonephila clavata]